MIFIILYDKILDILFVFTESVYFVVNYVAEVLGTEFGIQMTQDVIALVVGFSVALLYIAFSIFFLWLFYKIIVGFIRLFV